MMNKNWGFFAWYVQKKCQCLGRDEVRSLLLRVHRTVHAAELTSCTPVQAPNTNRQLHRCNVKCRNPYEVPLKVCIFFPYFFSLQNNEIFTVTNMIHDWDKLERMFQRLSECPWIVGTERCQTLGWWNINELQPSWEAREAAEPTSLISSWQWIFLKQRFYLVCFSNIF